MIDFNDCTMHASAYYIIHYDTCSDTIVPSHLIYQLVDQIVRVKCLGGRELKGALRGYDELVNLVLDDCEEFIRGGY